MNTVRLTPEERIAHDRASILMSIPHTIVDYTNDDGEIDWDAFEKENPELYETYCELSVEEIDTCIAEIYKSGGYNYTAALEALRGQREDVVNTHLRIP